MTTTSTPTAVPHDIQAASDYINNLLLSRGYISRADEIVFSTQALTDTAGNADPGASTNDTGGDSAMTDNFQNSGAVPTTRFERAINNDRKLLELLNTLLETIASDAAAHSTLQAELAARERALTKTEERLTQLQSRYEALDTQHAAAGRQQRQLEVTVRGLESTNKALKEELARAKGALQSGREQFANELRRKDVTIATLRKEQAPQRRMQPRGSTMGGKADVTGVTSNMTGVRGVFSKSHNSYTLDINISASGSDSNAREKLGAELDAAAGGALVPTVRALAAENSMLASLAYKTRLIVEALADQGFVDPGTDLSAQELDNIEALGYDALALQRDTYNGEDNNSSRNNNNNNNYSRDLSAFAARTIQRTTEVAQLGEEVLAALGRLAAGLRRADVVPAAEVAQRDAEIAELRAQITTVTANWRQAIRTMDEWKAEFQRRS
jgi:hypothetical protein